MITQDTKKLKKIITSYFVLANILFGLIGFGGAAFSFYGHLTDLTLNKLGQMASARAGAISEWLRLAVIVGTQPSRQSWGKLTLENHYHGMVARDDLIETTARVIDGALTYNHEIKGMARLDRTGQLILSRGQNIPEGFLPNFSPEQSRPRIDLYTEEDGGLPQMIISSPIRGRGEAFLGMDLVLVDTDPLLRLLAASYDSGLPGRTYMTTTERGRQRLIYSGEGSSRLDQPEEVKNMIDKAVDSENKTVITDDQAYAVAQVSGADWRIAIVVDKQTLLKPVRDQLSRSAGYFLVLFVFALTGLWFLALKPLTGRVEETTEALEEEVEETVEKLQRESEGRKKTETRLVAATHKAIVAKQAKSQFLANLSHEIRTPLNAVIGMTDLTLFTELNDEQRSYLDEVKKAAGLLLTQINDLLDLSKLQDGLMLTESRPFNLKALLTQMLNNYEMVGRSKGLAFSLVIGDGISPGRLGDPLRLKQVLNHLLDNAFKFTPEGRVELKASTAAEPDEKSDLFLFEVSDTGVGIEENRLETIFDPFVQADGSLTRVSGGTGLGLAVAKRLVELMGGSLDAKSTPGQGSVFSFTISLPPAPAGFEDAEAGLGRVDRLKGRLAVIADDNETIRRILGGYMSHWGMSAQVFENGPETLNFLSNQPDFKPDVFIMDALMPGLEAEELEKRLHDKYPAVPLIFLSSADIITAEKPYSGTSGRSITLGKPVNQAELLAVLTRLLSGRKDGGGEYKPASAKLAQAEISRRLLVVDDNQLNRRLASTLLAKRGHQVDEAENGQEALNAISSQKYDMVFMDIQMPVLDGLSAVKEIRLKPEKYGEGLPVVAMTAHALPGDQEIFLNAGMTAYISKPFKPHELIAVAEDYFKSKTDDSSENNGGKIVAAELDRSAILENFMDDEELLFESIDLFLERVDARMNSLRESVAAKNPDVIMPEAHTIKGMIGIFSTGAAFEASKKIEMKGREKQIDGVEEDLAELEKELEALVNALRAWRSGN